MTPDIEKYRRYVDKFDLPENEKIELIHTVWNVMKGFADQAFGLNSTQQAIAAQKAKNARSPVTVIELEAENVSHKSIKSTFERKA